jgi:hypothetical protein
LLPYNHIATPKTAAITPPAGTTNLSSAAALLGAAVDASVLVAATIVPDPPVAPVARPVVVRDAAAIATDPQPPPSAAPVSVAQIERSLSRPEEPTMGSKCYSI